MRRKTCPLCKCIKRGCRACVEKMDSTYNNTSPKCALSGCRKDEVRMIKLRYLRPDSVRRRILSGRKESYERKMEMSAARRTVSRLVSRIYKPRWRQVVEFWMEGKTFDEIGRHFNITKVAARQSFLKAVKYMRGLLGKKEWRAFNV